MDFNALSPNWDTDLRVKRAEAISAEIESYLGSGPLEMMEFGCGTGLISFHLKNKKALHKEDLQDYQNIFLEQGLDCFF